MKEMMIMLATAMEPEEIVSKLQEQSEKYLADPTDEEAKKHLLFYCHIFTMHSVTKGKMNKAMELIDDMDKFEKRESIFKTSQN